MESLSSTLSVSNASATGSGRSKIALKPGHSLMDWIRYTHSGKDLTSTSGRVLEVSPRELSKHNTKKDAWIALKGKVYNITPYLDYHPGGEEELMRGAGKDATDLFNQVHRWVNAESMLQKCFVGVLKKSWTLDVPKFPSAKSGKKQKNTKIITEGTTSMSPGIEKKSMVSNGVSEGYIVSASTSLSGEISISANYEDGKLVVKVISVKLRHKEFITDLMNDNLYIKFNKESHIWLNIKFPNMIKNNYEVKMTRTKADNDSIEFIFDEDAESLCNGFKSDISWTLCDKGDKGTFWPCKLLQKSAVNYNTYLFTFLLPPNVKMWIPIGCHVSLKSDIEGMEIVRSYTPVISFLNFDGEIDLSDGHHIVLMIKIYPSGTLTPLLNMCGIGESIFISNYSGSFSESVVKNSDSIVMLAAGTGITPMIRIIFWALTAKDKKRPLLLLFFNKTEDDILWKTEFENYCKKWENFQVIHILSKSSHKWNGHTGAISEDILNKLLPSKKCNNQQILICGPLGFTNSSLRLLEEIGYNQNFVYVFTG